MIEFEARISDEGYHLQFDTNDKLKFYFIEAICNNLIINKLDCPNYWKNVNNNPPAEFVSILLRCEDGNIEIGFRNAQGKFFLSNSGSEKEVKYWAPLPTFAPDEN